MAGGHHDLLHNELRDEVHDWCRRASFRPKLEKVGLLEELTLPDARRRPADVLICHSAGFLKDLPGEAAPSGVSRVALDFAVVNALGQGHHGRTLAEPLKAAAAYSKRKCMHERTQDKCAAAGIAFEPVVFELQGGVEPRAAAILHRIAETVAAAEDLDVAACKHAMLERLALILARRSSNMVRSRASKANARPRGQGLKRALAELSLPSVLEPE